MASDYCNGCVYKGVVGGNTPCCNYIFMEDRMRPCPPGEGCTVKMTNQDARRLEAEERRKKAAAKAREQRAKLRAARVRTVICPMCGGTFKTDQLQRKYCSPACAKADHLNQAQIYEERRKARNK